MFSRYDYHVWNGTITGNRQFTINESIISISVPLRYTLRIFATIHTHSTALPHENQLIQWFHFNPNFFLFAYFNGFSFLHYETKKKKMEIGTDLIMMQNPATEQLKTRILAIFITRLSVFSFGCLPIGLFFRSEEKDERYLLVLLLNFFLCENFSVDKSFRAHNNTANRRILWLWNFY